MIAGGITQSVTHATRFSGFNVACRNLAKHVARLMGVSPRIRSEAERERPASSEVERLVCDNSLLLKSTDWRPAHTLESGLRETIDWFTRQAAVPRPTEYHT